jgi:opacity protein-like surface antigen
MRKIRMLKALRISALLLVLAGPAHASDVLTPPAPQPPTQSAVAQEEPAADGYLTDDTKYAMTEITLDMLAVLPSLF